MSQIVKCDICGGTYNSSTINSHKRLSHGKGKILNPSTAGEPQKLEVILAVYGQLSDEAKKELRNQLATADQKKS
jgi:hypothetical protein